MLSCEEISKLVSESFEQKISLWKRLNLRFHLSMCRLCRRFHKDLVHLNQESKHIAEQFEKEVDKESSAKLSEESRDRMKRLLESRSP